MKTIVALISILLFAMVIYGGFEHVRYMERCHYGPPGVICARW